MRVAGYCTVTDTVVVLDVVPPVPLMVMVEVPLVAVRLAVTFIVEVPFPPEIDDGLKEMVVPLFCPEADNEIEETLP